MLCYCYGSVSDHFGPSAFNKFGFGLSRHSFKGQLLEQLSVASLFCTASRLLTVLFIVTGVGCFIGESFVGALAYADDIVLLAPTAHAMRRLLLTTVCRLMRINQSV